MEQGMPELEQRFKMFQQVRMYINDLLDCLNEKIGQIDELEEKVMDMWKQKTEFLLKRRRQDVQVFL
jgi:GC-rich sequence DNA-binding factor